MSTSTTEDWQALAESHSREGFAAAYDHPFLLALTAVDVAPRPMATLRLPNGVAEIQAALLAERRRLASGERLSSVLPVRKVQTTFPNMITVGRARNNDLCVPDTLVSKFHAFFVRRPADGVWTLADAGSSNGTRIGDHELTPKGAAEVVHSGDRLRFGVTSFRFFDAVGLWSALHGLR
jgi:hypothetical protein